MGDIEIDYSGEIAQHDTTPLKAAVVGGCSSPISEDNVTIVNADIIAEQRGMKIIERSSARPRSLRQPRHACTCTRSAGDTDVSGTLAHDGPHIVAINDFWVDIPPGEGWLLLCENRGPARA